MNQKGSWPKISVIIPAYNIETLIERCVRSVSDQTYPKESLEIIAVDDGSIDKTGAILDRLSKEIDNLKVYHQENKGSSAARNFGIRQSSGEYLGFVDSDDYISPQMYLTLMDAISQNGVKMALAGRDEIAENGEKLPDVVTPPGSETIASDTELLRSLLMHEGDSSFCTRLTLKSLFEKEITTADGKVIKGFPEGMLNEDFYLLFHMIRDAGAMVSVPGRYYHVYYRTGSNSRKRDTEVDYFPPVFTDIVNNADEVMDFVNKNYPELSEVAVRFGLIQRLDYMLHIPISKMTGDNEFYNRVVTYLRKNTSNIITNKYLSKKTRIYLLLLMAAPKKVRTIHANKMERRRIRG